MSTTSNVDARSQPVFAAHTGWQSKNCVRGRRLPGRADAFHDRYQATPGGEERRDRIRRSMEDIFLEATAGDDFIGVQTYSRIA